MTMRKFFAGQPVDWARRLGVATAAAARRIARRWIFMKRSLCCRLSYNHSGAKANRKTKSSALGSGAGGCFGRFLGPAKPFAAIGEVDAHGGTRGLGIPPGDRLVNLL